MNLKKERMRGNGPGVASRMGIGFQPNYLFGLDDLCKKFVKSDSEVLEIGSNMGVSTELFCTYAKSVQAVDIVLTEELNLLIKSLDNLSFSKSDSSLFFKKNKKKFDLIYIDACHSYESVKREIALSLKALKEGGVISGHDMLFKENGVLQAVNEMFAGIKTGDLILYRFSDSSWAINL